MSKYFCNFFQKIFIFFLTPTFLAGYTVIFFYIFCEYKSNNLYICAVKYYFLYGI